MAGIVSPIHIEAVGLNNVRFFAPPSGGSEFPWVSLDDILECMASPRELRRRFKAEMRHGPWASSIQMIAVESGIANIVPHFVAQGVIDAMKELGQASPRLNVDYAQAGARALSKLTDGLPASDLMAYIKKARDASGGDRP